MSQVSFEVLSLLIQTALSGSLRFFVKSLHYFCKICMKWNGTDEANNSLPCGQLSIFGFADDLHD